MDSESDKVLVKRKYFIEFIDGYCGEVSGFYSTNRYQTEKAVYYYFTEKRVELLLIDTGEQGGSDSLHEFVLDKFQSDCGEFQYKYWPNAFIASRSNPTTMGNGVKLNAGEYFRCYININEKIRTNLSYDIHLFSLEFLNCATKEMKYRLFATYIGSLPNDEEKKQIMKFIQH